ncbi:DUF333 domain-containing protein [Candidatus Woesearchaeota archaeon]|nr:DUF333 domain-containing protein [Candidatus Woesearchaeota archaeon]
MKGIIFVIALLSLVLFIAGCEEQEKVCITDEDCIPEEPLIGVKYLCVEGICRTRPMGNPASEYCLENNFTTEGRTGKYGAYSLCKFPDRTECEEWMFFNRECVPGMITIKMDQLRFTPEELHIKAGTRVIWKNLEDEPHQVMNDPVGDYAMGDLFDSQRLEQGMEHSFTFNEPGEYKYHCHIHQDMKAKIIVS